MVQTRSLDTVPPLLWVTPHGEVDSTESIKPLTDCPSATFADGEEHDSLFVYLLQDRFLLMKSLAPTCVSSLETMHLLVRIGF